MTVSGDSYPSISQISRASIREKASKFIAVAIPVRNEQEVKHHLDELKREFFDANHHCFAYMLGPERSNFRANDDGEPSGTAGKPILGQINSKGVSDVLVVVVRYFGGTKLGVPGLINAYRLAAQSALEGAQLREVILTSHFRIRFDLALINEVMKMLKKYQAKISLQSLDQQSTIEFEIRRGRVGEVVDRVQYMISTGNNIEIIQI